MTSRSRLMHSSSSSPFSPVPSSPRAATTMGARDPPNRSSRRCAPRRTISRSSVNELTGDVSAGSLDAAKDQVSNVEESARSLADSVEELGDAKRQSIQDDLGAVESTLGELSSADTVDDLKATLDTVESQLGDAVSTLGDTISC